jgi:Peptidase family M3
VLDSCCCREDKYAITDEELRPYFSLPNVLDGLFGLAKRLFDVDIEAADGQVWPLPLHLCTSVMCAPIPTALHGISLWSGTIGRGVRLQPLRFLQRAAQPMPGAARPQAPVWHPDVRFFKLSVQGQPKAYFYLDPYSRPEEKRGGAWMAEVCPWRHPS